jgi:hypothetical protein
MFFIYVFDLARTSRSYYVETQHNRTQSAQSYQVKLSGLVAFLFPHHTL